MTTPTTQREADERKAAFEDRHMGYEFPTKALRDGAFNEFSAGWKAALTTEQAALRKLCDQLDNEKRRMRHTPGTGQNHSYLLAEDVDAYIEEARKSLRKDK